MKLKTILKNVVLIAGILALVGCSEMNNPVRTNNDNEPQAIGAVASTFRLGAKVRVKKAVVPLIGLPKASLASAVDLTATYLVPYPGTQGNQNSCVGWAVGYAAKTIQEKQEVGWPISNTVPTSWNYEHHHFSPAFIYNKLCAGVDNGIAVEDAADLLVSQGCCLKGSKADPSKDVGDMMPYIDTDFLTQPKANAVSEAARFKAASWEYVLSVQEIKSSISSGIPVILTFEVYPDFDALSSSNDIYDKYDLKTEKSRGIHSVCIVGYNDYKGTGAFKIINSWGTTLWGVGGFGWISYSLITDPNICYSPIRLLDKSNTLKTVSANYPLRDGDVAFYNQKGTTTWLTYSDPTKALTFVTQTSPNTAFSAKQRLMASRRNDGFYCLEQITKVRRYVGEEGYLRYDPSLKSDSLGWGGANFVWTYSNANSSSVIKNTTITKYLAGKGGSVRLCALNTAGANIDWVVKKY
jgi:hypothetical protein